MLNDMNTFLTEIEKQCTINGWYYQYQYRNNKKDRHILHDVKPNDFRGAIITMEEYDLNLESIMACKYEPETYNLIFEKGE